MARRKQARRSPFPADRLENTEQVGGITTATLANGPGAGSRVAFVNTGGGLRYTVALDRGADLVHATHQQHSLCYLTQNGIARPSHAYHLEHEWLSGWPGGLMTTCGPVYVGHARDEDGHRTGLHGHFSNTPAQLEMLVNPDIHRDQHEMILSAVVRDSRAYGPNVEVRRVVQSTLGQNVIRVYDETTNRSDVETPHALMYHCNFGWPLLDEGARLIASGRIDPWPAEEQVAAPDDVEDYKRVPRPLKSHAGEASRGFVCTPVADRRGKAHVGLINDKLALAVEIEIPVEQLPRIMVWQHYGPGGMYVMGVEPMVGTPFGRDCEPDHAMTLKPGQRRRTEVTFRVLDDEQDLARFRKRDKAFKQ